MSGGFFFRVFRGTKSSQGPRDAAQVIIAQILVYYDELRRKPSLEPGDEINALLTRLVNLCAGSHGDNVIQMVLESKQLKEILPDLRTLCSTSEYLLEAYWSRRIHSGSDSSSSPDLDVWERLRAFPYFQNYVDLVRIELAAVFTISPKPPTRIAYIGSGPLPLTSLCMLQALTQGQNPWGTCAGAEILNIDRDEGAVQTSQALAVELGLEGMKFAHADAKEASLSLAGFEVVCLAALVGSNQEEKEEFLLSIAGRMDPGALVITRSSWGLRSCLYPQLQVTERLFSCLEPCLVFHPHSQVINSVVILRVKARAERRGHVHSME